MYEEITDEQIDIAAKNLLNIFNEIRKESNIIPVKSAPIYISEGAKLSSIGLNASSVSEILSLQREKDRSENDYNLIERIMPWVGIGGLGIGMLGAAYIIVGAV